MEPQAQLDALSPSVGSPGGNRDGADLGDLVQAQQQRRVEALSERPGAYLRRGSSTGKTRSAFEALRTQLSDWALARPVDGVELLALLGSGAIGPRTVLWLNEVQVFLQDQSAAASALRQLLSRDEPIVVIGTIWPAYFKDLTSPPGEGLPDANYQARELLTSAVTIEIPEAFAARDFDALHRMDSGDPRLEWAAAAASSDGKVIQTLAGGPELMRRYEHPADAGARYARAVVTAAMDIHGLGHLAPINAAMLSADAAAYLDPVQRAGAPPDWFSEGLMGATEPVHGISPLVGRHDDPGTGPADGYLLHDYLARYARFRRSALPVPAGVWDALAQMTASPADRTRLSRQAESRGLYRTAVALATPAAQAGDAAAMQILAARLDDAGHTDEAAHWRQRSAELGNVTAATTWAQRLREAGRKADAERILGPVANARGDVALVVLAGLLDETGDGPQAEELLGRAADAGDVGAARALAT